MGKLKAKLIELELVGKTYDEVGEQIEALEEAADVQKEKILKVLAGEESEESESEVLDSSQQSNLPDKPIEIDSGEEIINLDDSDTERKKRRNDRRRNSSKDYESRRRDNRDRDKEIVMARHKKIVNLKGQEAENLEMITIKL